MEALASNVANTHCAGNSEALASDISSFLSSISGDFLPLSEGEYFISEVSRERAPVRPIHPSSGRSRALKGSKMDKAMGPDRIPHWILKDCANIRALPVRAIYN